MVRRKNIPKTSNTARKSTAHRTPDPIIHQPQTVSKNDSTEMFKRNIERLKTQVHNELVHYKGPTGLGRGKQGLKRPCLAEKRLPKKKDIEFWARSHQCAIPAAPFSRLVRHITANNHEIKRFQTAAIEAMRHAADAYITNMFETSNLFVQHAQRVTVMCKDLALFKRVEGGHPHGAG